MKVRKAVITAAGRNQRALPLQTLVDRDGSQKSCLRVIVDEALSTGVEEICLVVEGGGELEVDGDRRQVGAGDAILIPPGAWHELTAGNDGVRLLCCCVPPYSDADTYFA